MMFPQETHILLVDDMAGFRFLIEKYLKELGYKNISQAVDGKDALTKIEAFQSDRPIGLLMTDLRMPIMDGGQLIKALRANAAFVDLPIILLTAEREISEISSDTKLNVCGIIGKPAMPAAFVQKLKGAWETHSQNLKKK